MKPYCIVAPGSLLELSPNTYYWYCTSCSEYHREIFEDMSVDSAPPHKSTITVITEEEYNKALTYLRL